MKKIKLLVKNRSYCSKNHANFQDGTRMNPNFTPKCFYWYVVFKNISHVCTQRTLILSISSSSVGSEEQGAALIIPLLQACIAPFHIQAVVVEAKSRLAKQTKKSHGKIS